jgi:hypothetical protein
MPSFTNSPWIRGAPQRRFSVATRRMRARTSASMRGLPGRRRGRRRQHPRNPSRCQRATVAGWTRTRASCQRGYQRRMDSHSNRSAELKRRSARPRTPSWWGSAKYSKRRSLCVDKADRARQSSGGCYASPVEGPAAKRASTIFFLTQYRRGTGLPLFGFCPSGRGFAFALLSDGSSRQPPFRLANPLSHQTSVENFHLQAVKHARHTRDVLRHPGRGAANLRSRAAAARRARVKANRSAACGTCPSIDAAA